MAETFILANLDPELMASDPAAKMLQLLRANASGSATPGPSESPEPSGPTGDNDMDEDPPVIPSHAPLATSLTAFGSLVKHHIKLTDKSAVALDQFCQVRNHSNIPLHFTEFLHQNRSPEERTVLLFAHVLELLDIARKNEKAELWTISSSLMVCGPFSVHLCCC